MTRPCNELRSSVLKLSQTWPSKYKSFLKASMVRPDTELRPSYKCYVHRVLTSMAYTRNLHMAICSGTDINRSLLKAQLVQWVTTPSPFPIFPSLNISVTTHLRLAHLLIQYSLSQTSSFFNFFDGSRQGPLWLAAIASHDHNTIPPNSRDRDWLLVNKNAVDRCTHNFYLSEYISVKCRSSCLLCHYVQRLSYLLIE